MKRIQRKRTKGWRMPPNTVYVGRPTKWGNPFFDFSKSALGNVRQYREWAMKNLEIEELAKLVGKDLCCWCPLDAPCHADVLIELIEGLFPERKTGE